MVDGDRLRVVQATAQGRYSQLRENAGVMCEDTTACEFANDVLVVIDETSKPSRVRVDIGKLRAALTRTGVAGASLPPNHFESYRLAQVRVRRGGYPIARTATGTRDTGSTHALQ